MEEDPSTNNDTANTPTGNRNRRNHRHFSDPMEGDMFGNLPLHQMVSRDLADLNIAKIKENLDEFPQAASVANQFGRLPLHYAVDHKHPSVEVIKLLVNAFPAGVSCAAKNGETPYDIGMWHS